MNDEPINWKARGEQPRKVYALVPSEREKLCDHPQGFPYRARYGMPCTGPRMCPLCGTRLEDK